MTPRKMQVLTQDDVDHFMDKGYVIIHDCFTKKQAEWMLKDIWVRLDADPNDKSTWKVDKLNMPNHRSVHPRDFAPKAWGAICDLVGGEERIDDTNSEFRDTLITNLGTEEWEKHWPGPLELDNWHVDGDFFAHYIDSREQGLLVTPIWSDEIREHGGGTMIAPDGIPIIARMLLDKPGIKPPSRLPEGFDSLETIKKCKEFVEITGKVGDVALCHPFMLHSATKNALRIPRFITNPKISLKENFKYDRPEEELSLVEKKTLKALGVKSLTVPPHGSERLRPQRVDTWEVLREEEKKRIEEYHKRTGTRNDFYDPYPQELL